MVKKPSYATAYCLLTCSTRLMTNYKLKPNF